MLGKLLIVIVNNYLLKGLDILVQLLLQDSLVCHNMEQIRPMILK